MTKTTTEMDNLFSNIAAANKEWFNNLVKTENKEENLFLDLYRNFFDNTKEYLEAQQKFYSEQIEMWRTFFHDTGKVVDEESHKLPVDKRFSDVNWASNPFFAYLKNSYLTMSGYLVDAITKSNMDAETKERLSFFMQQYLDAISPTNFALTNPEVIKSVIDTGGASLVEGMKNMAEDMRNGYITMTDESQFSVGGNLAVTKGKVIFKNDLIEIINYTAQTDTVYSIPLLIVPPCINKYYILDLQEKNSLVKYLVDQGYNVFLISWKSADKSMSKFRWEEYVELGMIKAIEVVREITKVDKINTFGYCIGGIILTTAYLVLQSRGLDWVNSMTHITTMLDHSDPGDIKFFIDRDLMELKEAKNHAGGVMSGRTISQTFSALRANELIWNYWVNNYLLGKTPQPFDILYWNNDTVDLPVLMHSFLLKRMYLHNELVKGHLHICNVLMDVSKINCPLYLFAAQKDHIVPWHSAYKTLNYVKENVRFVLGASGHTAGVINPVSQDKRNYWVNDKLATTPEEWFKNATEMPGSWWKDFSAWLIKYSGERKKPKVQSVRAKYKPIYDAPGENVRAKSLNILEAETI